MKLTRIFFTLFTFTAVIFSCTEDDEPVIPPSTNNTNTTDSIAPIIILISSQHMTVSLGSVFSDPGATATDETDGIVSVSSTATSTNPNTSIVGTYTVDYLASDQAGNTTLVTRTIRVRNDAEEYARSYSVIDSCAGMTFSYFQQLIVDPVINNRIHFSRFADYYGNNSIYADKINNGTPNSTLIIPNQTAMSIGLYNGGNCDVTDHSFMSSSYDFRQYGFDIGYIDSVITPPCINMVTCVAKYYRQ